MVKAASRWAVTSFPMIIMSLALAVLVWLVSTEESDPTRIQQFPQSVPVSLARLPDGMMVVGDFNGRVRVTLRTTASSWGSLSTDDFVAEIDLEGLEVGVHRLPVEVEVDRRPARLIQVEPEFIEVELELNLTRTVPVRVQIVGESPLGYLRRSPTVEPIEVMIGGPESYVERVVDVVATVSVQDAIADVEGEFVLSPLDADGHTVDYVVLMPDVVSVRIPIEISGYYRRLPVKVISVGEVAPGYRITGISINPPSATVFGSPEVIAALPGFIETEPIDLEGAEADVMVRPMLDLPDNVGVVLGDQLVEVRVSVEPIESSMTVDVVPELHGVEPMLAAAVSPELVQVILSGPQPLLEALEADDVRVTLNLFGLEAGTHQIEPEVIVPEGVIARSVLPSTVQVELTVAEPSIKDLPTD